MELTFCEWLLQNKAREKLFLDNFIFSFFPELVFQLPILRQGLKQAWIVMEISLFSRRRTKFSRFKLVSLENLVFKTNFLAALAQGALWLQFCSRIGSTLEPVSDEEKASALHEIVSFNFTPEPDPDKIAPVLLSLQFHFYSDFNSTPALGETANASSTTYSGPRHFCWNFHFSSNTSCTASSHNLHFNCCCLNPWQFFPKQ